MPTNIDPQTLQLAVVATIALAILFQAIVLLAILVTLRKASRSLKEEVEDLRSAMMPIIYNTRDLITRVSPNVESATADLADLVHGLKLQTADVENSAKEVVERVRKQAIRVDGMMSTVLDAVDKASSFMTEAVARPMRQLSGLLATAKAVVESLRTAEPEARDSHSPADKDMFV